MIKGSTYPKSGAAMVSWRRGGGRWIESGRRCERAGTTWIKESSNRFGGQSGKRSDEVSQF